MMRIGLSLIILLSLAGCDVFEPEIADCERFLQVKLRAPSTYHRIEAHKTLMDSRNPPELWVSITYEAANAYGTLIRGTQMCKYPLVNGRADISGYIDHDALPLEDEFVVPSGAAANEMNAPSKPPPETSKAEVEAPQEDQAHLVNEHAELCWTGYCPCDPPQGGADQLLCDQLRMGKVDPETLSVAKSMRDVRRQIAENPF